MAERGRIDRGRERSTDRARFGGRERVQESERDDKHRERDNIRERERHKDGNTLDKDENLGYEHGNGSRDRDMRSRYSRHEEADSHQERKINSESVKADNRMDRGEDEQDDLDETAPLQFAEQEEEDLNRIKEESRRRREAILEKYKMQQPQQHQQAEQTSENKEKDKDSVNIPAAVSEASDAKNDGIDVFEAEPYFTVGKSSRENGNDASEKIPVVARGLGEGTPKISKSSPVKKRMLMGDNTPYLPEEITIDILKRLPVKSLIRFQCVCKQWKNLIKSPSFIADHLHHSSQNRPSLLCKQCRTCEPLHLRLMDYEMHVCEIPNPPLIGSLFGVEIIGSSNGLLCVVINEYKFPCCVFRSSLLLWNPATREIREIPKTRASEIPEWDCNGFGFSAIVDDYKIVQTYNAGNEIIRAVEVYSLNTGSWKEIELGPLEGVSFSTGDCVTANGCIFWVGYVLEGEGEDNLIVSFDIAMEVFTLMTMPPLSNIRSFVLTVYENKVAILALSNIGDFPNYSYLIDLWVLEEGVGSSMERWSWTKKLSSNPCPTTLQFPGIIWRNEIVIGSFGKYRHRNKSGGKYEIEEENFGQYLFNIITNEGKMIAIPGCRFGNVYSHVESLVPIGNV